ncbi:MULTISPECIES: type IV pilus biogenesis/stability protein PilW [unclassified Halomonas]|uniref:type IV pilus biogenesis/stability protein PilW n=1 Tax=unclassified Halomonas TaxID=2609666 RepID=UPI0009906CE7|nr:MULTISPECIES: type IV pilus biogenesis/stability protein PilW [unclassified Halomonas]AQU83466.1 type IV pilus biogenesis/stability protein PilW [Halomonas sp. 'Soap Lake \
MTGICRRFPSRVPMLCVLVGSMLLTGCATPNGVTTQGNEDAADAYTQLGVAYLERENLPRALNALDRALEINPRHAEALQALALVYQQQGENKLAHHYFQQAVNTAPSFTRARNNYAAFLYQQAQFAAACEQLEIASQDAQYANRAQLFTNLGQCYVALEKFDSAREGFQRAQSIDPRNARGYLMLAELEVSQGNYGQAWEPLQSYLQLTGPDPAALEMAIDLAHARGDHAAAADYQQLLNTN